MKLFDERPEDELEGSAAIEAVKAHGRPLHLDCGQRCDRVRTANGIRFHCPVHGLIDWDSTRYGTDEK